MNVVSQKGWGILELMGHRVLAGRISEVEEFGTKLCRIEVPLGDAPAGSTEPERFVEMKYGGGAIYCLTPVEESVARERAARLRQYNLVDLRHLLPVGSAPEPVSPTERLQDPPEPDGDDPPASSSRYPF